MLSIAVYGLVAFCILMLFRNEWVYSKRNILIDTIYKNNMKAIDDYFSIKTNDPYGFKEQPRLDDLYISYEQMLWRFWIWDVEKFRK